MVLITWWIVAAVCLSANLSYVSSTDAQSTYSQSTGTTEKQTGGPKTTESLKDTFKLNVEDELSSSSTERVDQETETSRRLRAATKWAIHTATSSNAEISLETTQHIIRETTAERYRSLAFLPAKDAQASIARETVRLHHDPDETHRTTLSRPLETESESPKLTATTELPTRAATLGMMRAAHTYNHEGEHNLHAALFSPGRYMKSVRPIVDHLKPIRVQLGICLMTIDEIVEKDQKMVASGCIKMKWNDEFLNWDPEEFHNMSFLAVPSSDVWIPDIALINSPDPYSLTKKASFTAIFNNGDVGYYPAGRFVTRCQIHLTYFPFDWQKCDFLFESWVYPMDGLVLDIWNESDPIDMKDFYLSNQWSLERTSIKVGNVTYDGLAFSEIRFRFYFRRRTLYYRLLSILPCTLMSGLQCISHTLAVEHSGRMGLLMSLFLASSVLQGNLAAQMPKSSEGVTLIQIYLMVFSSSLIVSIMITMLNMHCWFRVPACGAPNLREMVWAYLFDTGKHAQHAHPPGGAPPAAAPGAPVAKHPSIAPIIPGGPRPSILPPPLPPTQEPKPEEQKPEVKLEQNQPTKDDAVEQEPKAEPSKQTVNVATITPLPKTEEKQSKGKSEEEKMSKPATFASKLSWNLITIEEGKDMKNGPVRKQSLSANVKQGDETYRPPVTGLRRGSLKTVDFSMPTETKPASISGRRGSERRGDSLVNAAPVDVHRASSKTSIKDTTPAAIEKRRESSKSSISSAVYEMRRGSAVSGLEHHRKSILAKEVLDVLAAKAVKREESESSASQNGDIEKEVEANWDEIKQGEEEEKVSSSSSEDEEDLIKTEEALENLLEPAQDANAAETALKVLLQPHSKKVERVAIDVLLEAAEEESSGSSGSEETEDDKEIAFIEETKEGPMVTKPALKVEDKVQEKTSEPASRRMSQLPDDLPLNSIHRRHATGDKTPRLPSGAVTPVRPAHGSGHHTPLPPHHHLDLAATHLHLQHHLHLPSGDPHGEHTHPHHHHQAEPTPHHPQPVHLLAPGQDHTHLTLEQRKDRWVQFGMLIDRIFLFTWGLFNVLCPLILFGLVPELQRFLPDDD